MRRLSSTWPPKLQSLPIVQFQIATVLSFGNDLNEALCFCATTQSRSHRLGSAHTRACPQAMRQKQNHARVWLTSHWRIRQLRAQGTRCSSRRHADRDFKVGRGIRRARSGRFVSQRRRIFGGPLLVDPDHDRSPTAQRTRREGDCHANDTGKRCWDHLSQYLTIRVGAPWICSCGTEGRRTTQVDGMNGV